MFIARPLCIQFPGALYYITAWGNAKQYGAYTQHINKKYQRAGHLFQGRFQSILVEKENYKESPLKQVRGRIFLGSEYFLANIEQFMGQKEQLIEIPRKQRFAARPYLEEVFQTNSTGAIKISQAKQKHGYTLKEIGQYLHLHYTTVSKIIKKVENEEDE